jgi:glycosyltransferase involved in cell wall biosynthesis
MAAPILIDLSHTSHTLARTGVQKVCRSLLGELGGNAAPVCYDPYESAWRPLDPWEKDNLKSWATSKGRGARWPLGARIRGHLRKLSGRENSLTPGRSLIVPEIFSPGVGSALPKLFAATTGPRVALFHDAIALQYPEYAPRSTVARFPGYLQELLQFDAVAAVSEASRRSLLDYWKWLGVSKFPEVAAITLGISPPSWAASAAVPAVPTVLCVSSIEGRKNHLSLLQACESLWSAGVSFQLRLVGLANTETGSPALNRIEKLRAAGRNIRYDGALSDEVLESAYAECLFTVYPSFAEGFGLPVAESLLRGKPCACRMEGALGEIAAQGGCRDIGAASPAEISAAIGALLGSPSELADLKAASSGRRFKTWAQYASELQGWMATVKIIS